MWFGKCVAYTCNIFDVAPSGEGKDTENDWHETGRGTENPLAAPHGEWMRRSHAGTTWESQVICNNGRYGGLLSSPLILFLFFTSQCEIQSSPYPTAGLISLSSLVLSCYPSLKTNSSHSALLQLLSACWQCAACVLWCHFTSGGESFEGMWTESWYLFTIKYIYPVCVCVCVCILIYICVCVHV